MPFPNEENLNSGIIVNQMQSVLKQLRDALNACEVKYQWTSSLALTDLTGAPINMDVTTAQSVINSMADAHAEFVNHFDGLPATLPATGYKYGTSQTGLIGPT
jgi:hypothetical protein